MVDPDADPVTTGVLQSSIGYLQWSLGQGEAALASHELAVALVPAEPPSAERAKVLGGLAGALMGEGRWAPSRVVSEAAVECAVAAGATVEESRARNILGSDLVALGQSDAGIEQLREACRLAAAVRARRPARRRPPQPRPEPRRIGPPGGVRRAGAGRAGRRA